MTLTGEGTSETREPNNARITDALARLNDAIYQIKRLGQKINGTQEPPADKAEIPPPPPLSQLINELPDRLHKAEETIRAHVNEIQDMIL